MSAGTLLRTMLLGASLMSAGCSIPTKIIQNRHWELNEIIRQTHVEQLLLNIVRLRYDEMPYFLQMSSISTQFSTQTSVGVSGTIPEGAPKVLGLDGALCIIAGVLTIAANTALAAEDSQPVAKTLITNARIFDGKSGKLTDSMSVLVEGNKIAKISYSGNTHNRGC